MTVTRGTGDETTGDALAPATLEQMPQPVTAEAAPQVAPEATGADIASSDRTRAIVAVSAIVFALLVTGLAIDFIAFHLIAEITVVVVLVSIFTIAWYNHRYVTNGYLIVVGMAALPVALLTLVHAITYPGMPVMQERAPDLPTQLWLAARYVTAAALLIAPAFAARRLPRPAFAMAGFAAAAALLAAAALAGVFPEAFVQGEGLTTFKIASEYVIIAAFLVALALLWRVRAVFTRVVYLLLAAAIVASVVAELLFTAYTDPHGLTNLVGHLAYLFSFCLFYIALVDVALRRPYALLFRELAQSNAALAEAHRLAAGMNEISAEINSTLERQEILTGAVGMAGMVMKCDAAVLSLCEGERFRPQYFWGYSGTVFDGIVLDRDSARHVYRAVATTQPVAITDTLQEGGVSQTLLDATGVRAVITTPIIVRGAILGSLSFHWRQGPHEATSLELDFARNVGTALALALDNALSYAAERDVAETLQADMVPVACSLPGLDIGYAYVPAPGPGRIGGDFYDVIALDDGRAALLIGDVAGRGLAAATTNSMTRTTVRALVAVDPDPGVVLQRAGTTLSRELEPGQFVTAILGLIEPSDGSIWLASRGHGAPVVAGRPDLAPPAGFTAPPLGVAPESTATPWRISLNQGDTVVLFTDGAYEARRGAEFFGHTRLQAAIHAAAGAPTAQELVDDVLAAVREFAGTEFSDDLAILAVRYVNDWGCGPAGQRRAEASLPCPFD